MTDKIAFVGDWHQDSMYAIKALKQMRLDGVKTVYHTGDFMYVGKGMKPFLKAVNDYAKLGDMTVYFVDGNHEDHVRLLSLKHKDGLGWLESNVAHIERGHRWEIDGLRFLGLGGATSLDKHYRTEGVDWFPEEAVSYAQAVSVMAGGETDVLISHDCPHIVRIPGLNDALWRPDALEVAIGHRKIMTEVVQAVNPTHIFHGHFHTKYVAEVQLESGLYCLVNGLDCNGSAVRENVLWTTVAELVEDSALRRHLTTVT